MKIAEIETTDDGDTWREWKAIYLRHGRVHVDHEYLKPGETQRHTWQDEGTSFEAEHLDRVIDALVQARAALALDELAAEAQQLGMYDVKKEST